MAMTNLQDEGGGKWKLFFQSPFVWKGNRGVNQPHHPSGETDNK